MAKRTGSFVTRKTGRPRRTTSATFIQRSRQESSGQKAAWNNPSRTFFDLNQTSDPDALKGALETLLAKRLGALGR